MRVLFVTPEAAPLVKTGGLGDVAGALPAALRGLGVDARILLPGYPGVLAGLQREGQQGGLGPVARDLRLLPGAAPVALLEGRLPAPGPAGAGVPLYVLRAPGLYEREGGPYLAPDGRDWPDNHLRFGLLGAAAARLAGPASPLAWRPDVVHGNDWQAGLAPAYLRWAGGGGARTVTSVHNLAYLGVFPPAVIPALGLPAGDFRIDGYEFHGQVSFLKAGVYYADRLATVSPTYAEEIQHEPLGQGLHGLLAGRRGDLRGIVNGIDTAAWDPRTDPHLVRRYDAGCLEAKRVNRSALRARLGLPDRPGTPLAAMICRLAVQKGVDLLAGALARLAGRDLQCVVLGRGEPEIERALAALEAAAPERIAFVAGFDEPLAHQIEAGADLFLMPSRYEPCGLNQMYSMRYGTPPVVRRTGGLADTVVDATPDALAAGAATGFVFVHADAESLAGALGRALDLYADPGRWRALQRAGMARDFGWTASARAYAAVYDELR